MTPVHLLLAFIICPPVPVKEQQKSRSYALRMFAELRESHGWLCSSLYIMKKETDQHTNNPTFLTHP
ncbi:Hypothetical predicted protein [Xyrichtys novacula]|uniref:Secreted protein n=1 Tax=Xyrichtys novacula TaxID=13765 RepID=A0AAV1HI11_XYRNO|nr:Hypothetical predicted protein [Xyrichtys novacula]